MTPGASPGRWLLDLDLGQLGIVRASTRPTAATYRVAGAVRYVGGLTAPSAETEAASVSVEVALSTVTPAEIVAAGPFRGRRGTLRYWRGEAYADDAVVICDGVIDDEDVAPPDAPGALRVAIRRATDVSSPVIDVRAAIGPTTYSGTLPDNVTGEVPPRVIGAPGRPYSDSPTLTPYPAVPAWIVDSAGGLSTVLVADGHAPAAQIELFDLTAGVRGTYPIAHGYDDLGRPISTVDLATGSGTVAPDPGAELATGWSHRSGWGRGTSYRGEEIAGLGDLLAWGAQFASRAVRFDTDQIESRRPRLNRYQVDAVVNTAGYPWSRWVAENLLDLYRLEEVHGPRGVYWREIPSATDPARVAATLVCDRSAAGIAVERVSGVGLASSDPPLAELTVAYAPTSSGALLARVVYSPEARERVYGEPDTIAAGHPLLARSAALPGAVSVQIDAWSVGDQATAALLGREHVAARAYPWRAVSVTGRAADLLDLPAWGTVRVVDARIGLDVLGLLVPAAALSDTGACERTVRIPPVV